MLPVVVHWLSETLTNQSDISILCDSYTLWSILIHSVEKNMFNFILCFCLHTDKNLAIYPSVLLTLSQ
jgi:hypothetical protein